MTNTNTTAERKRPQFEAYILRDRGHSYLERNDPSIDPEHDYADPFVQEAWEAWQACAELSAGAAHAAHAALSTLRDLQHGWPSRELHEPIEKTIDRLAGMVGDDGPAALEAWNPVEATL